LVDTGSSFVTRPNLGCIQRITDSDVDDYHILKENLLKGFRLMEAGSASNKVRQKVVSGETPEQFVNSSGGGVFVPP